MYLGTTEENHKTTGDWIELHQKIGKKNIMHNILYKFSSYDFKNRTNYLLISVTKAHKTGAHVPCWTQEISWRNEGKKLQSKIPK